MAKKAEKNINEKITALYCRLSVDDIKDKNKDKDKDNNKDSESNSITNQVVICKGWFLHPNTYDCGSFVVN